MSEILRQKIGEVPINNLQCYISGGMSHKNGGLTSLSGLNSPARTPSGSENKSLDSAISSGIVSDMSQASSVQILDQSGFSPRNSGDSGDFHPGKEFYRTCNVLF